MNKSYFLFIPIFVISALLFPGTGYTCLMWKLTTYSAFILCTLIANGSVGWNVKATRRRAVGGGFLPRTPA